MELGVGGMQQFYFTFYLLSLRVGFFKPLLVGTKRHKLGLVKELVLLHSVGAEKI